MKKAITLIFSIILIVALSCAFVACNDNGDGGDEAGGGAVAPTIDFGAYPQSKVMDSAITASLNILAGTLPSAENNQLWTSYGYYIAGNASNFMWYIDLEQGGEKYRGVYFTSYRPLYTTNSLADDNDYSSVSFQDNNDYVLDTVYWFKYEPISWSILSENYNNTGGALVLCNMIIDSQQWDYDGDYSNNYAESTIRNWLNDTFYNTAFSTEQKALILAVTVDNSVASTAYSTNEYACANTEDKVFLPSYAEVTTNEFLDSFKKREKKTTDYAKSQGCFISTGHEGNGYYWLRSPYNDDSSRACFVHSDGDADYNLVTRVTDVGVAPAMVIDLSSLS